VHDQGTAQRSGLKKTLYIITAILLFTMLIWLVVVPDDLLRTGLEDALSVSLKGAFSVSISELRKSPLFLIHIKSILITMDGQEIIEIKDLNSRLNPLSLFNKKLYFTINGKTGRGGTVSGYLSIPTTGQKDQTGILRIKGMELDSIPFLKSKGLEGEGHLSAVIRLNEGNAYIEFDIPDLEIVNTEIPALSFMETFHEVQGAININDGRIEIRSLGLEGEKGYARLRGYINRGGMDLTLELMPYPDKLTEMETMLIGRYEVSPGYYEIPIRGRI